MADILQNKDRVMEITVNKVNGLHLYSAFLTSSFPIGHVILAFPRDNPLSAFKAVLGIPPHSILNTFNVRVFEVLGSKIQY